MIKILLPLLSMLINNQDNITVTSGNKNNVDNNIDDDNKDDNNGKSWNYNTNRNNM